MNKKNEETLKRLKLQKKYTARFIDENDKVMFGMVKSVMDEVAFGKVDAKLEKELKEKRGKKDSPVMFLHPPRGGFKGGTKNRYPQGIRGKNPEIAKFAEKML